MPEDLTDVFVQGDSADAAGVCRQFRDHCVKDGEKTCHWGGVKLYHLGGA